MITDDDRGDRARSRSSSPGVTLAVLDTVRPGTEHGRISAEQLEWLDELAAGVDRRRCSCSATTTRGTRLRPSAATTTSASIPTTAKRCARVIARRESIAGYFAGHTHRNADAPLRRGARRADRRDRVREGLSRRVGRVPRVRRRVHAARRGASPRPRRWRGPRRRAACSRACIATTRWGAERSMLHPEPVVRSDPRVATARRTHIVGRRTS